MTTIDSRGRRWVHLCTLVALAFAGSSAAKAITIDARTLTSSFFNVVGYTSNPSTAVVQTVNLAPGTYQFADRIGNQFDFTVDAGGHVGYDPGLEGFLDGAGTTALTVQGRTITIDGRGLASSRVFLSGLVT